MSGTRSNESVKSHERTPSRRPVLALTTNVLDGVTITESARRVGVRVIVASPENGIDRCAHDPPSLVVIDLTSPGAIELVESGRLQDVAAIGFHPHVDRALAERARAAGLPSAMPRSAFFGRLAQILSSAAPAPLPERGAGC